MIKSYGENVRGTDEISISEMIRIFQIDQEEVLIEGLSYVRELADLAKELKSSGNTYRTFFVEVKPVEYAQEQRILKARERLFQKIVDDSVLCIEGDPLKSKAEKHRIGAHDSFPMNLNWCNRGGDRESMWNMFFKKGYRIANERANSRRGPVDMYYLEKISPR
jgi:hypothetical protein